MAKALEKDKSRRYASAGELASDIRRYLQGGSILARRSSSWERCWRWARLNPSIAVLGGVLAGVLVLSTAVALLAAGRFANMAKRRAPDLATAERSARAAAQDETYRAMLSEVKALRAGRQPGWRGKRSRISPDSPSCRRLVATWSSSAPRPWPASGSSTSRRWPGSRGCRRECIGRVQPRPARPLCRRTRMGRSSSGMSPQEVREDVPGWPRGRVRWASRGADVCRYLADGSLVYDPRGASCRLPRPPGPSVRPARRSTAARAYRAGRRSAGRWIAIGWTDSWIRFTMPPRAAAPAAIPRGCIAAPLSPDGRWLATEDRTARSCCTGRTRTPPSRSVASRGGRRV